MAATAAMLVAVALTNSSAALAVPTPEAAGKLPTNITPVDQIPAEDAGAQIAAIAAAYPEAFAGTHWDAATKTLYVNVAAPRAKRADLRTVFQQAVTGKLRSAKSPVKTVFRPVPLSLDGQQALLDTFMAGRAKWGGQSAVRNVVGATVDAKTGTLFAQVSGDLAALRTAAQRRFGKTVSLRPGTAIKLDDRYYSSSPWTAGNALWGSQDASRSTAQCTQGYNWRRWADNLRYASTAGHCWAPGTSLYNGLPDQRIGYVGTRYLNTGEYVDFEYIRITYGSVDNSVWVGGTRDASHRRVLWADNDGTQTGVTVCSSGANFGLNCGVILNRTTTFNYGAEYGYASLSKLTCVSKVTGYGPGPGDSGGPVLTTATGGAVKAWGQYIGRKDCDGDGDEDWVFAGIKNIAARVGASLIVS
ncbi:S1 family peptidase [Kribbella sp. NBC_01245]|uniref:hypothetical protein n=1 Tax=Kribbella sp. NBC_01245 TaxID=2903578 RepID=UPI002E28D832|nr:hypothetical protein [Kribbella sp. NBC_01245]